MKIEKLTQETRLHNTPVPVIGLTGGIATGKSTVSKYLIGHDIPVICADKLVHEIYENQESLEFISQVAPAAVIDGKILFPKLRELFFADSELQKKIETFIYSKIGLQFREKYKSFNNPKYLIYDVPLLFEKGLDKLVDYIVVVYSSRSQQIERLINRDKIDKPLAESILDKQFSIEDKKSKADYIIENNTNLDGLEKNIESFLKDLKS